MSRATQRHRVAVVGAGYWGPNLIRNFLGSADWDLVAVCDLDETRARRVLGHRTAVDVETSVTRLLGRSDLDAIAIATPARTHAEIALAAFAAGKHVLVEKPLAESTTDATRMIDSARRAGRVLMIDHTYCYTPAARYIRELIAAGELGDVLYVDSTRINLGLVQPDVDVFWDLAPHDLSILDFVLPAGLRPERVSAVGADPLGTGRSCVGYLTLPLPGGGSAHIAVNWLSPTKIRQVVIGGSRRTLIWDDLNPQQRISVYDRGVDLTGPTADVRERTARAVSYRTGDMVAPALTEREALASMVSEFAAAITEGRQPDTDGLAGLRVLSILEAATESLESAGAPAAVVDPAADPNPINGRSQVPAALP